MLTFFGTPVMTGLGIGDGKADLSAVFGIDMTRAKQLSDYITQAEKSAISKTGGIMAFDFSVFLNGLDLDLESPGELTFAGMCISRIYAENQARSTAMIKEAMKTPEGLLALLMMGALRKDGHNS